MLCFKMCPFCISVDNKIRNYYCDAFYFTCADYKIKYIFRFQFSSQAHPFFYSSPLTRKHLRCRSYFQLSSFMSLSKTAKLNVVF